jgi:hypothetical protein
MVARSVRAELLDVHKRIMFGVAGLATALTLWALAGRPMSTRGRLAFMLLLLVLVAAMTRGADY